MPFKMIELYNEKLIENHKKSKLWKCATDENGEPSKFTFATFKSN